MAVAASLKLAAGESSTISTLWMPKSRNAASLPQASTKERAIALALSVCTGVGFETYLREVRDKRELQLRRSERWGNSPENL